MIPSSLHQEVENRVKRQVGKVEPSYAYDANDYDYNANDADQYESSGNGYHYDDLEDTYDTEDDEFDPDKVMPSRVVPSLVSPSFEGMLTKKWNQFCKKFREILIFSYRKNIS